MHVFEKLCFTNTFENFLAEKFNTSKRFGLDSGEAIVLALKGAIDSTSKLGAHSFIIGILHMGRLNELANAMRKLISTVFSKFQGMHYNTDYHTKGREDSGSAGRSRWVDIVVYYVLVAGTLALSQTCTLSTLQYHLGSIMDLTYPNSS